MIDAREMRIAGAAYLSALGYYVEVQPEIVSSTYRPDIVGILPRLRDLMVREKRSGVPAGLLYMLLNREWMSLEEMVKITNYNDAFIGQVLLESEAAGWTRSKVGDDGTLRWTIDKYEVPVKECLMIFSGVEGAESVLNALEELKGCYHKGIILFPYPVTNDFMDVCFNKGIGILQYYERIAYFDHILPPEWQTVEPQRRYISLCEKILHDNRHFRDQEVF